jgi:hypothetical protein
LQVAVSGDPEFNPNRHHDELTAALGKPEHGGRLRTYPRNTKVRDIYGNAPRRPLHAGCVPRSQYDDLYNKCSQYESQYGAHDAQPSQAGTSSQQDDVEERFNACPSLTHALLSVDPSVVPAPSPFPSTQVHSSASRDFFYFSLFLHLLFTKWAITIRSC